MLKNTTHTTVWEKTRARDEKNLATIAAARDAGKIDDAARRYLDTLYSNGMDRFRSVFYVLGKCLGAPKGVVMRYDYANDRPVDEPLTIADINPLEPYLVSHRLDADPMRNQFFTSGAHHKIDLAVSSIVTVIVGAQKNVDRALTKITGKYYDAYVDDVANAAERIIAAHNKVAGARAIAEKIREKFGEKYISSAPEAVLEIIGRGHENIAVELVRELDKIVKPHMRLQDVWRVKCLFDLIPQARTFVERIREMMPDRIISVNDNLFNVENTRNYRDIKLVINIGRDNEVVPMEIICQLRKFFEFEHLTHKSYEISRRSNSHNACAIEKNIANLHRNGLQEYNKMVYYCLEDLFERIGWNILYSQDDNNLSFFDGFPRISRVYYPQKIIDGVSTKLGNAIENEVFQLSSAPAKLTQAQTSNIFQWMAKFIMVAAMPQPDNEWNAPSDTMAGKLFNFVMKEIHRYYHKKDA